MRVRASPPGKQAAECAAGLGSKGQGAEPQPGMLLVVSLKSRSVDALHTYSPSSASSCLTGITCVCACSAPWGFINHNSTRTDQVIPLSQHTTSQVGK